MSTLTSTLKKSFYSLPLILSLVAGKSNAQSLPLEVWPLNVDNTDSASLRSPALAATTPTSPRFYVSNGTTVTFIPAYSSAYGQAFGCSAAGDGLWSTSAGGPGGNLNRQFYEQFTVTANTGYALKIDSFVATSAFYNTSSGTKLAVVYSHSNFVSDSNNVTGGTGPNGVLVSTANGAFTTPISLANQTSGPTNVYSLALNDAAGVVLDSGKTLTIRVYFSCSSSSAGRYGLLKNVYVAGSVTSSPLPLDLVSFGATNTQGTDYISWTTMNESAIDHFELQKSVDAVDFTTIKTMKANNTTRENNYSIKEAAVAGNRYYRLKIVEINKSSRYSNTAKIMSTSANNTLDNIYPNPATTTINVKYPAHTDNTVFRIVNMTGRTVKTFTVPQEIQEGNLNISDLPAATYQLQIIDGQNTTSRQFVKIN